MKTGIDEGVECCQLPILFRRFHNGVPLQGMADERKSFRNKCK